MFASKGVKVPTVAAFPLTLCKKQQRDDRIAALAVAGIATDYVPPAYAGAKLRHPLPQKRGAEGRTRRQCRSPHVSACERLCAKLTGWVVSVPVKR